MGVVAIGDYNYYRRGVRYVGVASSRQGVVMDEKYSFLALFVCMARRRGLVLLGGFRCLCSCKTSPGHKVFVAIACAIAGLYAVTLPVGSQTSTPTPTAALYHRGELMSIFPGGYDEDAFWRCTTVDQGPASTATTNIESGCSQLTWSYIAGDSISNHFGYDVLSEDDSGIESMFGAIYLIPPQGVYTFTLSCDLSANRYWHAGGGSSLTASAAAIGVINSGKVSGAQWGMPGFPSGQHDTSLSIQQVYGLVDGNYLWSDVVPGFVNLATPGNNPGSWVSVQGYVNSPGQNNGASGLVDCVIAHLKQNVGGIEMPWIPGDVVFPPTVTPVPAPTSVWDLVPWIPITNPLYPKVELGSPMTPTCYSVLPEIDFDGDSAWLDWFSTVMEVPDVQSAAVEFCATEYDAVIEIWGIDVGAYLVVTMALVAGGALFKIMAQA